MVDAMRSLTAAVYCPNGNAAAVRRTRCRRLDAAIVAQASGESGKLAALPTAKLRPYLSLTEDMRFTFQTWPLARFGRPRAEHS
jgi:hypothetical protein